MNQAKKTVVCCAALSTLLPLALLPDSVAAAEITVRDEFNAVSFSNNDGPDNWAGPWIEIDPEAGGAGPTAGQVRVVDNALRLDDQPDTGGEPSAARAVDLTGMTTATFTFDFWTTNGVDTSDAIAIEVSSDGASWTVLETLTGIQGASSGSRSFDIGLWVGATTHIRFRVAAVYGGSDEFFFADNVQIRATDGGGCNDVVMRDDFNVDAFTNNDGPDNWAGPWIENDPAAGGAGPSAGQVQVFSGALRLDDYPDTGGQPSAAREVMLEGAASGSLSFAYSTSNGVDTTDAVTVEVSADGGGSWTVLEIITGISGATSATTSHDITGFAALATRIRFRISNSYGGSDEYFRVDWVQVEGTCVIPVELQSFTIE